MQRLNLQQQIVTPDGRPTVALVVILQQLVKENRSLRDQLAAIEQRVADLEAP